MISHSTIATIQALAFLAPALLGAALFAVVYLGSRFTWDCRPALATLTHADEYAANMEQAIASARVFFTLAVRAERNGEHARGFEYRSHAVSFLVNARSRAYSTMTRLAIVPFGFVSLAAALQGTSVAREPVSIVRDAGPTIACVTRSLVQGSGAVRECHVVSAVNVASK